jgi:hypothetical protein
MLTVNGCLDAHPHNRLAAFHRSQVQAVVVLQRNPVSQANCQYVEVEGMPM